METVDLSHQLGPVCINEIPDEFLLRGVQWLRDSFDLFAESKQLWADPGVLSFELIDGSENVVTTFLLLFDFLLTLGDLSTYISKLRFNTIKVTESLSICGRCELGKRYVWLEISNKVLDEESLFDLFFHIFLNFGVHFLNDITIACLHFDFCFLTKLIDGFIYFWLKNFDRVFLCVLDIWLRFFP